MQCPCKYLAGGFTEITIIDQRCQVPKKRSLKLHCAALPILGCTAWIKKPGRFLWSYSYYPLLSICICICIWFPLLRVSFISYYTRLLCLIIFRVFLRGQTLLPALAFPPIDPDCSPLHFSGQWKAARQTFEKQAWFSLEKNTLRLEKNWPIIIEIICTYNRSNIFGPYETKKKCINV